MSSAFPIHLNELLGHVFEHENAVFLLLCSFAVLFKCVRRIISDKDRRSISSDEHSHSAINVTQKQKRSKTESQVITSFNGNLYRKKFPKAQRQHSLSRGFEMKSSHSSIFCFSDCLLKKTQMMPGMFSSVRLLETNMPFRDAMPSLSVSSQLNENSKPSFLASIKPENYRAEKTRFMQSNYNYNPCFVYSYPVSNKKMKRFRAPSNKYMPMAVLILKKVIAQFGSYENYEEISGGSSLTKDQILKVVERYLIADKLTEQIHVHLCDDLISRGSLTRVKGATILNVRCANMRQNWAEGLLRHEIGTHYIRSRNNRSQPWGKSSVRNELKMGPVNPTEEGLASLHSVLFRTEPYLWRAALLYYTTYMASKMSFKELFHDLGCFSKDQVYLEGALQLLKRRKVLDFQQLIRLGKVSFEDLDRPSITSIAKLTNTRIPCFMEDMHVYLQSLDHIANTNGLTDCVLESVD